MTSRLPGSIARRSAILLIIAAQVGAQTSTGSVTGAVSDEGRRPLAGAQLIIGDASATASAGRDGGFRFSNITAGSHRLVATYLGYQPETLTVTVAAGRMASIDVVMRRPVQMLSAIKVESSIAGQAAALNQQKAALNVASIVDAELVGRLPDRNLAEALGRVPGIALVRDQGEGRFVQIRGTNATLNTLSIDGMRMPSPDPGTRQTPMDVIPSDMVASIQVNKTLTPDMDADAIGGNVNLVTPSPRSGMPVVSLNVAGGQNMINGGKLKNASGFLGRRFGDNDKLGILAGGSYYQNDRGSQNYEMGWCVETTCRGVAPASALDAPTQIAIRNYSQVLRTRQGGNVALDYRVDASNTVFIKAMSSKFSDSEERYVTTPNFSSGTYVLTDANHGTVTGARMDKELRLRPVSQVQTAVQAGGNSVLFNSTIVDYAAQFARATEDRPNTLTMAWRQSSMDFGYDVTDEDQPKFTVTKGAELDASKFLFNSLRQQTRHARDDEMSGRVNVARPFVVGDVPVTFKVGGSARLKDRLSRDSSNRFLNTFKAGASAPASTTLASLEGSARTSNFLDGKFNFGPQASSQAVKDFWNTYGGSLNKNAAQSLVESNTAAYDIAEDVYAGYAMATVDIGPLRLITGARLENTMQAITGNFVKLAGTTVTITPQATSHRYMDVLPSVSAKWTVSDRSIIRAAATKSLVRPNFGDLPPAVSIPDGTGVTASIGNPNLKPITSVNLDLMIEHYLPTVGFLSAGVFHKKLSNYIFTETRDATSTDGLGATVASVAQAQNAEDGTLDGLELAWQQNFPMLPGLLSGLGLNANYTLTTSSTTLPSRNDGTKARLPGQAGNAANVGLFYEYSRLALKLGYNFSDSYLEVVGASPHTDIYVASRGQLDFSGGLQLTNGTKLFFETNNLTNQPLRRWEGQSARSWQPGNEYYRSWGMIGVRIQQ
ncbi:MAG: TonB-dependent receptor [bacterium]